MTVLITGGGGFIGLNLAEVLTVSGRRVVLFDMTLPPEHLYRCLSRPDLIALETGDVRDMHAISATIAHHGVTDLVHGAAITASLDREAREASRIFEVNLLGVVAVLEAAIVAGLRRVILLGSGSVYGQQVKSEGYLDEEEDVAIPDSLYGISKLAAERVALRYRAMRSLDVSVARLGVAFGPWEYDTGLRDTLSIPHALLSLAQTGQEARILSRIPDDWVHGGDVASGIVAMLDASNLQHGLYHLSAGRRWDVAEWCCGLNQHFPNFTWRIVDSFETANVGQLSPVPRPPFSTKRITSELGWQPQFIGADALQDLLAWHRNVDVAAT